MMVVTITMIIVVVVIMVMLVLVDVVDGDAFWTIVVGVGGDNVDGDRGDDGGGRWCIR